MMSTLNGEYTRWHVMSSESNANLLSVITGHKAIHGAMDEETHIMQCTGTNYSEFTAC